MQQYWPSPSMLSHSIGALLDVLAGKKSLKASSNLRQPFMYASILVILRVRQVTCRASSFTTTSHRIVNLSPKWVYARIYGFRAH